MKQPWVFHHNIFILYGMIIGFIVTVVFTVWIFNDLMTGNVIAPDNDINWRALYFIFFILIVLVMITGILSYYNFILRKFAGIINIMQNEIVEIQKAHYKIKCITKNGDVFQVEYQFGYNDPNGFMGSSKSSYKISLTPRLYIPLKGVKDVKFLDVLKNKLSSYETISIWPRSNELDKKTILLKGDLISNIKKIKTLKCIYLETQKDEKKFVAILEEKWLYPMASDVCSTIETLRRIEKAL